MTLKGAVHHLTGGGVKDVQPVFSHQVALAVRFGGEHDRALRALEGLLTCRLKKG